jgi:hypothetical protein
MLVHHLTPRILVTVYLAKLTGTVIPSLGMLVLPHTDPAAGESFWEIYVVSLTHRVGASFHELGDVVPAVWVVLPNALTERTGAADEYDLCSRFEHHPPLPRNHQTKASQKISRPSAISE